MEDTTKTAPELPEAIFDIDAMPTTNNIVDMRQEGNWLIAVTEHGIKFRHRIPQGKRLNKKGDTFVLEDSVIG